MMKIDQMSALFGQYHILGACGLCLGFLSGAMAERSAILLVSAACAACFGVDYWRMGASTGAAMCALSVAQSLTSARFGGAVQRPSWFAAFFTASAGAVLALTAAS